MGSPDSHIARFCCFGYNAIKQIRGFGGLILQPEMKPPKIVPDPEKNKEGKEMNLLNTHHTVFTTLRSFRDKGS